jgi:hypothetical protein
MKKITFFMVLVLISTVALSQKKLPFQGKLLNAGAPVNGTVELEFTISDPAWSETQTGVFVQDGYYSVVLGSVTPLPDSLFQENEEIPMNISVDGQPISTVTLYAPFVDMSMDNAEIVMRDPNGGTAVFLTSKEDGDLQLLNRDPSNSFFESAVLVGNTSGANVGNGFIQTFGLNTTSDGTSLLLDIYGTSNDVFGSTFSGGFRRGGIDVYDNEGGMMAAIGLNRDETGGDPTGKSGLLMVNGPTTRNAYVSGKWWENSELGTVQVFGQNDDGAGDFLTNVVIEALDQTGESSGALYMNNTANGGTSIETFLLQSNDGSGNALMEIRDNTGSTTIALDGAAGNINANGDVAGNTLTSSDGSVQTSDRRLKKDIQNLDGVLDNVLQMRGVSYRWKDESRNQALQLGVIAQEVEEIYPQFVRTGQNGMKAVNYAQMTAVLIEAVKELHAKIEKLEDENSALREAMARMETLEKQVKALEKVMGDTRVSNQ